MKNKEPFISQVQHWRADGITAPFGSFLSPGETVLSVGDGDGSVSKSMQGKFEVIVQGLDVGNVLPVRAAEIPLEIYDGKKIPFEKEAFDVVTAIFVLHHCEDVEQVLSEIIRVSSSKIIICEDVYKTWFGKGLISAVDYIGNRSGSKDMPIHLNFRTTLQWEQTFTKFNLKIIRSAPLKVFSYWPVKHQLFFLQK